MVWYPDDLRGRRRSRSPDAGSLRAITHGRARSSRFPLLGGRVRGGSIPTRFDAGVYPEQTSVFTLCSGRITLLSVFEKMGDQQRYYGGGPPPSGPPGYYGADGKVPGLLWCALYNIERGVPETGMNEKEETCAMGSKRSRMAGSLRPDTRALLTGLGASCTPAGYPPPQSPYPPVRITGVYVLAMSPLRMHEDVVDRDLKGQSAHSEPTAHRAPPHQV